MTEGKHKRLRTISDVRVIPDCRDKEESNNMGLRMDMYCIGKMMCLGNMTLLQFRLAFTLWKASSDFILCCAHLLKLRGIESSRNTSPGRDYTEEVLSAMICQCLCGLTFLYQSH